MERKEKRKTKRIKSVPLTKCVEKEHRNWFVLHAQNETFENHLERLYLRRLYGKMGMIVNDEGGLQARKTSVRMQTTTTTTKSIDLM